MYTAPLSGRHKRRQSYDDWVDDEGSVSLICAMDSSNLRGGPSPISMSEVDHISAGSPWNLCSNNTPTNISDRKMLKKRFKPAFIASDLEHSSGTPMPDDADGHVGSPRALGSATVSVRLTSGKRVCLSVPASTDADGGYVRGWRVRQCLTELLHLGSGTYWELMCRHRHVADSDLISNGAVLFVVKGY